MNPTPADASATPPNQPAAGPNQQPTQPIPQQPMQQQPPAQQPMQPQRPMARPGQPGQQPGPYQPGQYTGQYAPQYTGQYPGQYAGQYAGQQGQPGQQPWGQPGPQQPWGQQPGQQPGAPAAFLSSAAPGNQRTHRWRRRTAAGIAALAIAGAAGLGGLAVGHATAGTGANTPAASSPNQGGGYQPGGGFGGFNPDNGYGFSPNGGGFNPNNGQSDGGSSTPATQKQQTGIVTINTVVDYGQARAAGTGMVLSSDGLVLTNHHVVDGSTQIEVTVETTGKTYQAEVVGTDASNDVAVLRLKDASNLTPATIDHDDNLKVGDTVTTVGNAEGRGDLVQASGPVTALNQTISASTDGNGQGETLTGLIQANVDVVSGDSGGAMLDSQGEVVGMTTAASTGGPQVTGYAIDIDKAQSIADQIESGHASDTVHIGPSAFLGVQLTGDGTTIAGTVNDSPAARAGLQAGDTVTEVDGTRVGSAEQLSTALGKHKPGDKVAITWTTADGSTRSATVTLVEGPVA
jgi:S1-C subfamily serine protease